MVIKHIVGVFLTCGAVVRTLTLAVWGTGHWSPHCVHSTQT